VAQRLGWISFDAPIGGTSPLTTPTVTSTIGKSIRVALKIRR
jgi:hypothetical protein